MKRIAALGMGLLCISSLPARAAMDLETMQAASGLAEIISNAEHCGYKINETALETYYVKKGLAEPDTLSFISSGIATSKFGEKPGPSTCTLSRTTARSIGILAE